MAPWAAFPHDSTRYERPLPQLHALWAQLHRGDAEPWPADTAVQRAWADFHGGRFQQAHAAGLQAGGAGITVANKAQALHAAYVEPSERRRLAMFAAVAERAQAQAEAQPDNPNAHYWHAYALARGGQGTSVVKAMAEGLAAQVKAALERTLALQPAHADACVALGMLHAEVIDKVGKLLGKTQGADTAGGLHMFQRALSLNPSSPIAAIECARGMLMLDGPRRWQEAEALYQQAAACEPLDAAQHLEVEMARQELGE